MVQAQGWTANDGRYPAEEAADGWHPSTKVRLFPNRESIRFSGEVHEMVETSLRQSGFAIQKAPFVVHHYGELAEDLKNFDKQLNYLETGMKKLEQNPDDLAAIAELAVQAGELGQFEQAISLWDRVLCRLPDAVEALFNKGYCLIGLQRYAEALIVSRNALEHDPDHKEAAFNYGTCELYVGDPRKALETIAPIAEKYPDYPLLQALMAVLLFACDVPSEGQKAVRVLTAKGYAIESYIRERAAALNTLGRENLTRKLIENNRISSNSW
jgi:tetratricopeptide (TPR) repeat protein